MSGRLSGNVTFLVMLLLILCNVLVAWAGVRVGMAQGQRDRDFLSFRVAYYERQSLACNERLEYLVDFLGW